MRTTSLVAAVCLVGFSLCASATAQSFLGLGDLAGGGFSSTANALSGDGRFVTGESSAAGDADEAFLWSLSTGMVGLGVPTGRDSSQGFAVSNDGSVVVGAHQVEASFISRAYQWTTGGGPADFDPFPTGVESRRANDLSADGETIVGTFLNGGNVAYHWNGGTLTEIEDPGVDDLNTANAVSADGTVVVGRSNILNFPDPQIREAYFWTAADGITLLGFLPGASDNSSALGVSADGNVIVGTSDNASSENEAFRWTVADGMVGLGDLPGGDFDSVASDTTANGSIVVGSSNVLGGSLSSAFDPFIWDETNGMRNLVDVLTNDYGLGDALDGWDLFEATAISDDGRVIIGNGINPNGNSEAWIAIVPEPSTALLGGLAALGLLFLRWRSS